MTMPLPRVWNKRDSAAPEAAVYIGRPGKWGNPFAIGPDGSREQVIAKYREWLLANPDLVRHVQQELAGKDLLCFCSPLPCHGDVLLEVANGFESAPVATAPQIPLF